jgi:hypothetical protein
MKGDVDMAGSPQGLWKKQRENSQNKQIYHLNPYHGNNITVKLQ